MLQSGFIEILDRAGQVKYREKIGPEGLTLGRGYENDLIIDDPYMCPKHLQLTWNEDCLMAFDLDSVNGMRHDKEKQRKKQICLNTVDNLHIGRTTLRFRPLDYPIGPTKADDAHSNITRLITHFAFPPVAFLFAYLAIILSTHLGSNKEFDGQIFGGTLMVFLPLLVAWSTIWAFTGKIISQKAKFLVHCGIACTGILFTIGVPTLLDYASFAAGFDSIGNIPIFIIDSMLIAGWIFLHLSFVSQSPPKKHVKTAIGFALLILSFTAISENLMQDKFSYNPRYEVNLKPPFLQLTEGKSPPIFFQSIQGIRDDLRVQCSEE